MDHASVHRFGAIRTLTLGLFAIGAAVAPALAQGSGTWTTTGSLSIARINHTGTRLQSGQVLASGGVGNGSYLTSAELYEPSSGKWSVTGSMNTARQSHTATLLNNGEVLVAGGDNLTSCCLSSTELYNPSTGVWAKTGSMTTARVGHTATLLQNGKVLIAGGSNGKSLASAELYDPATGKFRATGSMNTPRQVHRATLLQNGQVLVVGGDNGTAFVGSTELYDPATGRWTPTSGIGVVSDFTLTLLTGGKVLLAGGAAGTYPNNHSTGAALLYDPSTATWTATGSLNTARCCHKAMLLLNGQVLTTGGEQFNRRTQIVLASAELYTP